MNEGRAPHRRPRNYLVAAAGLLAAASLAACSGGQSIGGGSGTASNSSSPYGNQLAYQYAFTQNNFNGAAAISIDLLIVALACAGILISRGRLFRTD